MLLSLKTEDLLKLSKKELIEFLIDKAKCKQEDIEYLLKQPKKEVLEFLISRLMGHAVNIDYELLLTRLPTHKEFMEMVATTIVKTIAVNMQIELQKENLLSIEITNPFLTAKVEANAMKTEIKEE
jgi:hypothetical protein